MTVVPLFPLPVVLFPGALMPLHIFEPRYRQLVADVAEADHRFAIVAPIEPGPDLRDLLGTVARIRAIQPLADGRSNIVVSGERRITVLELVPSTKPYLLGETEPVDDQAEVQVASADDLLLLTSYAERYGAALGAMADVEREPELSADAAQLSFQVAALIEWDFPTKLAFLGIRSARERVTRLLHALPALLLAVERRAAVHHRAGGNGKGLEG